MKTLRRLSIAALFALGLSNAVAQAPPVVPALPDTPRLTSYTIAGTTCTCAVNFALYGNANLADYQDWVEVFLNGVQVAYNDPTYGWTITSPTGALASIARPITDAVLTFTNVQTGTVQIVGASRPARLSQWSENQGVSARNLNVAFTGIVAQLREVWDKINDVSGRDLKSQPGNTVGLLPLPAACSNAFLGFDSTGLNPLCRVGPGSGNVVGPATSTVNHLAAFGNTTGSALLDIMLGNHLSIGSSTLSTDALGTGILATRGDIATALPSLTTSQLYGGTGAAGAAQLFPAGAGVPAWLINPTSANLAAAVTDKTGTGALVFGIAPTITLPNATGLPIAGISGLGAGVATALGNPLDGTGGLASYADVVALGGVSFVAPPSGRLTLVSATPYMTPSGATNGVATVFYTPTPSGNQMPVWNGSAFAQGPFIETSQALNDTTRSPAAAIANAVYDEFECPISGVPTITRGPAWSTPTTRSLGLARGPSGIFTNASNILNGSSAVSCAAGYGVWVGTIATDAGAATVSFNPTPAAASGGPVGGAWLGLWNEYNRVPVGASAQDSKASWAYTTASWRSSDNSTNNRITAVFGVAEDGASASFTETIGANSATSYIGVGIDSVTVQTIATAVSQGNSGDLNSSTATAIVGGLTGQHYFQALEYSSSATFYGFSVAQVHQISAQLRY